MTTTEVPTNGTAKSKAATKDPARPTLVERIAAVSAALTRIEHDGEVTQGARFSYTSADAIADTVRPLMAEHGLVMHPIDTRLIQNESQTDRHGRVLWVMLMHVTWRVTDGVDSLTVESLGKCLDSSDKGPGICMTYARKNALIALFNISTGENHEAEHPTIEREAPRQAGQRQQQRQGGQQQRRQQRAQAQWKPQVPREELTVKGRVYPFDSERTAVEIEKGGVGFDDAREGVKAIGGRWDAQAKVWLVPHENAERLQRYADYFRFPVQRPNADAAQDDDTSKES